MAGRAWNAFIVILVPFSAVRAQEITSICFCSVLLRKTGKSQWLESSYMKPRELFLWHLPQLSAS